MTDQDRPPPIELPLERYLEFFSAKSDRLMEALGARGWTRRQGRRAMRRLRAIIERDEGRGRRVTVAGG